jgi:hypothetical protein
MASRSESVSSLRKRVIDLFFKFFAALATKRVHSEGLSSVGCNPALDNNSC